MIIISYSNGFNIESYVYPSTNERIKQVKLFFSVNTEIFVKNVENFNVFQKGKLTRFQNERIQQIHKEKKLKTLYNFYIFCVEST